MVKKIVAEPLQEVVDEAVGRLLLIMIGRGRQGKTLFIRWLIERTLSLGRRLLVGDADRTNATLSEIYPDTLRPKNATDAALLEWFRDFTTRVARNAEGISGVIDVGGGDTLIKTVAAEGLVEVMAARNVTVVPVFFIGGDRDDLKVIETHQAAWSQHRPKNIIVFNKNGLVDLGEEQVLKEVFGPDPIFQGALAEGSKLFYMPRLMSAPEIERRRMRLMDARDERVPEGQPELDIWTPHHTLSWLEAMEQSAAACKGLLP